VERVGHRQVASLEGGRAVGVRGAVDVGVGEVVLGEPLAREVLGGRPLGDLLGGHARREMRRCRGLDGAGVIRHWTLLPVGWWVGTLAVARSRTCWTIG